MKNYLTLLVALTTLAPAVCTAQGEHHDPAGTVAAFHAAMAQADETGVLALLDPEVTIFESGGAEMSREIYASHHLDQQVGGSETSAWVTTRSETGGNFRGKEIDLLGTETMLLENDGHGWKIIHIHWSSRARSTSH